MLPRLLEYNQPAPAVLPNCRQDRQAFALPISACSRTWKDLQLGWHACRIRFGQLFLVCGHNGKVVEMRGVPFENEGAGSLRPGTRGYSPSNRPSHTNYLLPPCPSITNGAAAAAVTRGWINFIFSLVLRPTNQWACPRWRK